MTDIILHHYPQSPVSEKVRVALGIKQLAWRSVEIPRVPPKPDVIPLTGGYRRTPIMQIGADIFCDSHCILRELQRRHGHPTFHPGGSDGLPWAINRWGDLMFDSAVRISLAANADQLPEAFAADRARLFLGPHGNLQSLKPDLLHFVTQLRPQLGWLEKRLATGCKFILGDEPGLPDAVAYFIVWFVRGRWTGGPALLAQFPALQAWELRVKALGHGSPTPMTSTEALDIALKSEPVTPEQDDPGDPLGLRPGHHIGIIPDLDSGEPAVHGTLRSIDRDHVALLRSDPRVGEVCVHFPRLGYRIIRS